MSVVEHYKTIDIFDHFEYQEPKPRGQLDSIWGQPFRDKISLLSLNISLKSAMPSVIASQRIDRITEGGNPLPDKGSNEGADYQAIAYPLMLRLSNNSWH